MPDEAEPIPQSPALDSMLYVCSCGKGGRVSQQGTDTVEDVLASVVRGMLNDKQHERHQIEYGPHGGSVKLDLEPRPLVWSEP
jgi:hypothetical protein